MNELARQEPERADLQVELWVPLTRLGLLGPEEGRPMVERAISILERLQGEGRLDPAQESELEMAREMLESLDAADD